MGKHNGVEDYHLSRYSYIGAQNGDGRIELATIVEEGRVLHFGKRFVGVWVVRGSLNPCPGTHAAAPPNDTVDDQAVLAKTGVAK